MTVIIRTIIFLIALVIILLVMSAERVLGVPFLSFCAVFLLLSRLMIVEKTLLVVVAAVLLQAGFLVPVWLSGSLLILGSMLLHLMKNRAKLQAVRHVVLGVTVIAIVSYWQHIHWDAMLLSYVLLSALLVGWLSGTVVHTFGVHREITIR